ncbi:MAG: geranylgeranyl reductase family protein [Burkholderiales bacterium]|nr:geranylgeranyl reductase family protein [Burkholderiales bacterium]
MPLARCTVYDAIVVGAGPAGAHLAYRLARAGRRVALLEQHRFPREKVCGGGVSRKSVALLELDLAGVAQRWISGAFLTFQNRSAVVKDLRAAAGCTVLRSEFDQALLERAREAGAEVHAATSFLDARIDGAGVAVSTSRGELAGLRLYGADGAGSAVRTKVFGKRLVGYVPALEALIEVPPHALDGFGGRAVFDFGAMPKGYGWIFPKRDHLNVGVFSPFGAKALGRHLDAFIARYPALRAGRRAATRGYAIPLRNNARVFERGPVALLGDAAGLAECVFGEGIYFALKSAELAAQAELARERNPAAASYTRLLGRALLPELRAARVLAWGLYTFQEFAFRHAVCSASINRLFAGLISGDTGYRECLYRTLLAAPAWIARPAHPGEYVIS